MGEEHQSLNESRALTPTGICGRLAHVGAERAKCVHPFAAVGRTNDDRQWLPHRPLSIPWQPARRSV
jgi:hypothetical protein